MSNELNAASLLDVLRLPNDSNQPAIGIKQPLMLGDDGTQTEGKHASAGTSRWPIQ
jgi:hypothetical protein